MTNSQKEQITYLRGKNESYTAIANTLKLSVNTVKSFCRRNNFIESAKLHCEQCGKGLDEPCQNTKRFCSDVCRMAWWKSHPEAVTRKAVYHFFCAQCGAAFESYGNANRKYCSRACYGKSKAVMRHD